jgi:chromosome segregation protein
VHLKTLSLRGFKSFASASTLRLEPGITCVVGPNGSGKSNIVDALSWVMGEQGAKSLRGGKMEDVVFAGTTSRPALGRAEVTLTIDNSDGALPIEYAEVTISRLLFRSGQSEYSINGDHCRLLDLQDLLSDSGLGREMHVIVGQGQLDEVLHAGPEARRALIEEAAGVLKHRKRKEKALRKLEAMQANMTRLVDLTAELHRRLKPLGRQAEIARKAAVIQADLRDARLRLLADDYLRLATELNHDEAGEATATARRAELEAELTAARALEAELEEAAREHAPRLARAQETWFALSSLAERLRGVASLASERHRHLAAEPEPDRPGRDPDEMEAEAAELRAEEETLTDQLAADQQRLAETVAARSAAEAALAAVEREQARQARESAATAERLAKLRGQVGAARSRGGAAQEEITRLTTAQTQAAERAAEAEAQHEAVAGQSAGRDEGRADLAGAVEQAKATVKTAAERVAALRAAERQASSDRAGLRARRDTLEEAFSRGADASGILLGEPGRFGGVLGSFAAMLTVDDGGQHAIAAALGAAADAVAVTGLDEAVAILDILRAEGSGTAALVIANTNGTASNGTASNGTGSGGASPAGAASDGQAAGAAALPDGARRALDLVHAPVHAAPALRDLLADVVVATNLHQAAEIVAAHPTLRVVTRHGDLLGAHWAHGGSGKAPSLLETRAAANAAAAGLDVADRHCEQAALDLAEAVQQEEQARQALTQAQAAVQEADGAAAKISGQVGMLAGAARAAQGEADRLAKAVATAERARENDIAQLEDLERQLAKAEAEEADAVAVADLPDAEAKEVLAEHCDTARTAEMEARLEVRTIEERVRAIAGRGDALARAAVAERQARERAADRLARRTRQATVARAVAQGIALVLARIERSIELAAGVRQAAEQDSVGRADKLTGLRARITQLAAELENLVDRAHTVEIQAAEHRMKLEQLATRAAEEFGVTTDILLTEYGPGAAPAESTTPPATNGAHDADPSANGDGLSAGGAASSANGTTPTANGTIPSASSSELPLPPPAFDRAELERRAHVAERQLAQLGKVNPLALEEFAALEERHTFLSTQLEDLKKTRRDLLTVVKEVDDRVQQVFASAYEDVAREFEGIFGRLFPGGQGRLVLTEPEDILATGIEIEARPPGKKVKRLSLLSGGERSLTAIAYLVAIFKARPSPFYVLDEVEAALDDTNLQRLLVILEELREVSQLIIITHQKRTMEVADSLYGVSMRGDGVSTVISQRMRERV